MGKGKWLNATFVYETQQELEKDIDGEHAEDLKDGDRIPTDYEQPLTEEESEGDVKQP
jgi:hypothetical protein